jgi:hypothetical protein
MINFPTVLVRTDRTKTALKRIKEFISKRFSQCTNVHGFIVINLHFHRCGKVRTIDFMVFEIFTALSIKFTIFSDLC